MSVPAAVDRDRAAAFIEAPVACQGDLLRGECCLEGSDMIHAPDESGMPADVASEIDGSFLQGEATGCPVEQFPVEVKASFVSVVAGGEMIPLPGQDHGSSSNVEGSGGADGFEEEIAGAGARVLEGDGPAGRMVASQSFGVGSECVGPKPERDRERLTGGGQEGKATVLNRPVAVAPEQEGAGADPAWTPGCVRQLQRVVGAAIVMGDAALGFLQLPAAGEIGDEGLGQAVEAIRCRGGTEEGDVAIVVLILACGHADPRDGMGQMEGLFQYPLSGLAWPTDDDLAVIEVNR